MSGCSRMRVDRHPVAVDHGEDTVGHARLLEQLARNSDADGSFSDGLRMNVLPQAMALANIHIGTMAGKLNGVMPATTPSGWRIW